MTWDEEMKCVVGTVWTPQDAWQCGVGLYVVVARDRGSDHMDAVLVLDLQTGAVKSAHYDPDQRPSDPTWKVVLFPFERHGLHTLVPAPETT